jgi:hypothetical protein
MLICEALTTDKVDRLEHRLDTRCDYAGQDPINLYDLDGTSIIGKLKSVAKKATAAVASKASSIAVGAVLATKTVVSQDVAVFGGGTATVASYVKQLSPAATALAGGVASAAGQAVSDAFVSGLSVEARVGRVVVAGAVGASATAVGAAVGTVCVPGGVVTAVVLNHYGQTYVAGYVDRQFGFTPRRP